MNPPGTKTPAELKDVAKAVPAGGPGSPASPCRSCTVTIAPSPVKICNTKTAKTVTATVVPAGGSFTWTSVDPKIATVTGSGKTASVKGVKQGQTTIKVECKGAGCTCSAEVDVSVCTCTPAPGGGRHYTSGFKTVTKPIGVRAKIKTRYGKVCCEDEGCSTLASYNVVYANVSGKAGKLIWAQTGFGRERQPGTTTINTYRYAEMKGATYHVKYDSDNPPGEGSTHLYQCVLDKSTGKWTYTQDGTDWLTFSDKTWKNRTGESIQYTGEIINHEDDMAGTAGDKCELTECQYLQDREAPTEEKKPSEVLSDFGFDQSDIKPEHETQLDSIAEKVAKSWKTPPEIVKIRLVGHADAVGSPGYNKGLGQRRALAARGALVKALEKQESGLSGKVKIVTESKGESELLDKSGTPEGDAKNRRVEVFLTTNAEMNWKDADLAKADVSSDDDAEWGAEWVSGTALNIWDKQPLP
jgi:outer membrane protein OmpA-like peptidoglycan-associated protein